MLDLNPHSILLLLLIFVSGMGLLWLVEKTAKPKRKWGFRIFYLIFCCLVLAIGMYFAETRKEKAVRLDYAERIADNRDTEAEKALAERVFDISEDSVLLRLSSPPLTENRRDSLQAYILENYFYGAFPGYQFYLTFCRDNELLAVNDRTTLDCKTFFDSKAQSGEASLCENLYVIDYSAEHYTYLYRLQFDSLSINIEMGRRKLADAPTEIGLMLPSAYSYAFYADNSLLSHTGNYLYAYRLTHDSVHTAEFINENRYSHLLYPLSKGRMLILSAPQTTPWDILYIFSFFFLIFGIVGSLILLLTDKDFMSVSNTYRQRLRVTTYLLLLATFVIFGLISVLFMRKSYQNENLKSLRAQSLSVLAEMESRYGGVALESFYDSLCGEDVRNGAIADVEELSNLFRTAVYVYDADGFPLSEEFSDLIPDRIDGEILAESQGGQRHLSISRIKYGKNLSAWVAVAPYRNADNEILGYLYIPYFAQGEEWRNEMNRFLGVYLSLMMMLSLLIFWISSLLADHITGPLALIAKKVSQISLTHKNEHLPWKRKDEIGTLVEEYNRLVSELEVSSRKLAENERERAWNEMARQVAHEIKNPLTPMKLQVEQLQRAYKDGKSDFPERLERFTAMMTGQIDRLAAIAGTFSQFAKWGNADMHRLSPKGFLENIFLFYKSDPNTKFRLEIDESCADRMIEADEKFLEQIFHNLVKNAVQALTESETQDAEVVLGMTGDEETLTLYVRDNGPGIPGERVESIFNPHFTTRSTGAGLGLAICRKLSESMHASIVLEPSTPGACFKIIFKLPV